MFESDDFDQVLSQFDFPGVTTTAVEDTANNVRVKVDHNVEDNSPLKFLNNNDPSPPRRKNSEKRLEKVDLITTPAFTAKQTSMNTENMSPKHTKRKIINSYFDHNAKRKFPGPAGLLSGNFVESKDGSICHMELFSQDIDMSEIGGHKFESHIWSKLTEDTRNSSLGAVDSIKSVKQQALAGNLRKMKAQAVTACVETIDRSVTDPLITLRDTTGHIKCTLHRDAWLTFSPYIVSEFCALVLRKPTVLTTGSAFKRHYLNITLSNIYAIYSSAILREDNDSKPLPNGYSIDCDNNMTVIKIGSCQNSVTDSDPFCNDTTNDASDLLDDLDNIFTDDSF